MNRLDFSRMTLETIDQAKALMADAQKTLTVATGLTGYSLESPAKKLYPVLTPLRNRIARRSHGGMGATATNWKAITGINTANTRASVAFGSRNTSIVYSSAVRVASFKSFGQDDNVQQEAVYMGRGFEDVLAFSRMACLQATMISEEDLILGGMDSSAAAAFGVAGLGTPGTPVGTSGTGGSVANGTYVVNVMALPYYGARFSSLIPGATAVPMHSANSPKSVNVVLITGTNVIKASVAPVAGAAAYAWFVEAGTTGTAGALEAITAINSVSLSAIVGTNAALTASIAVADNCGDANAFDGVLTQVVGGSAGSVFKTLPNGVLAITAANAPVVVMNTGVAGVGTGLTADNAAGITEFDALLLYLWNTQRLGPQRIICSGTEAKNITTKIAASTGLVYRAGISDGQGNVGGSIRVTSYLNKFTGEVIDIEVHPTIPQGTILFETDRLPYPNSEVPSVLEMELLFDYLAMDFAMVDRRYQHGVYANGVLKHYYPAGFGLITNIADL